MNLKSAMIIALATAFGSIVAQFLFDSLTIVGALAAIGASLAAGISVAYVQYIGKNKSHPKR